VLTSEEQWHGHLGSSGSSFDPATLTAAGSLPRRWSTIWAAEPSRPILHSPGDGRWITAGELEERTRQRASALAGVGVKPGDRVVYCLEDPMLLIEWHVAALRMGAVAVPTNPAYREKEFAHVVVDSDPAVVVLADAERSVWAASVAPGATVVHADVRLSGVGDIALDQVSADAPALLPYTSGTTGVPKGALLTHGNLLSSIMGVIAAWRWTPDDRLVLALPLFHMHGLGVGLHGTLAAGASAVVQPGFDPSSVLAAIDEHRASLFFGVPTMYAKLSSASAPDASRLKRLRLCVSGSAPLAPELFHRIEQVSGQRVLERYGMTETVMNLSNPYDHERRPGTVGFALPGVQVRLSQGESGEIELRGPNIFAGYWHQEAATQQSFTDDGWFKTGDLAEIDQDGYHRIVGRAKELIISGGYNVYPREIEDALLELAGVREVAVVGTPSLVWGEIVTAFVVRDGSTPDEGGVKAFCSERLAGYKRPRSIVFVDRLPRNALGKILRDQLSS
jgi:malonyl-CoA/methylmalonyl-CoA synthetase